MGKKAILVISFGTSHHKTREKTIGTIEKAIGKAFAAYEVRRAFTSSMIIHKLKKRDGIVIDSVQEALDRLYQEGFQTVICQPTHVMNGFEYEDMMQQTLPFTDLFETFVVGKPLLSDSADYQALVDAVNQNFEVLEDTALCLLGHGTTHHANSAYAALEHYFKQRGRHNCVIGTVEGYPDFDAVSQTLDILSVKKVILAPLMIVAGEHAIHDMAGKHEHSWKSQLIKKGYAVETVLRGLGEYTEISEIYINHVQQAIESALSVRTTIEEIQ